MKYINYFRIIFQRINEYFLYKNRRKIKINKLGFKQKIMNSKEYQPIFFLSTGRTGTEFFTKLLNKSHKVQVFHSPSNLFCNAQAELIEQGKISYEMYIKYRFSDERTNKLIAQIFMASREELLYKTYLHEKVYIETNNRITFLAPAIKSTCPNAKFVYLHRHPGEFIRSGIRRGYYKSTSIHETGRLCPTEEDSHFNNWKTFSDIEKIGWLWNETNEFIENYLLTLREDDYFKFNFNDLTEKNINSLLNFLNIDDIDQQIISDNISNPTNIQKSGVFPEYSQWKKEDKEKVISICGELSLKYGYSL